MESRAIAECYVKQTPKNYKNKLCENLDIICIKAYVADMVPHIYFCGTHTYFAFASCWRHVLM